MFVFIGFFYLCVDFTLFKMTMIMTMIMTMVMTNNDDGDDGDNDLRAL